MFDKDDQKTVFAKARKYVSPGAFFKFVSWLYAERKLVVFFWAHFVATMVIWCKFHVLSRPKDSHDNFSSFELSHSALCNDQV